MFLILNERVGNGYPIVLFAPFEKSNGNENKMIRYNLNRKLYSHLFFFFFEKYSHLVNFFL